MQVLGDVEALQQSGSVGFGGVAALIADDAFELADADAVFVGPVVRVGVKFVALFERFPERGVAHDDGVEHAVGIEGELVLAQDSDLLGAGDGAFGGFQFTAQDFHEGGFAGAVGSGDGVAAAGEEGGGYVLEESAGAEAHRDIVDRNHGRKELPGIRLWSGLPAPSVV